LPLSSLLLLHRPKPKSTLFPYTTLFRSNINTTMNIYAHLTKNVEKKTSEKFKQLIQDLLYFILINNKTYFVINVYIYQCFIGAIPSCQACCNPLFRA